MAKTIQLIHPEHGLVKVAAADFQSDGADGHGWSKKETEARGFKVATEAQIAAAEAKAAGKDEKKTDDDKAGAKK